MGEVHNWRECKRQLCLISQRLLLLVYNQRLGEEFSRSCVRKLRECYLELLDDAESRSAEGVGAATYSTPAFKTEKGSGGTATPARVKEKEEQSSEKEEPSEEEGATSAPTSRRVGGTSEPPVTTPEDPRREKKKRSRSRRRRRRSEGKKSPREDRSASRGRSKRSRSHVEAKRSPKKARSPDPDPERKGSTKASTEPERAARPKSPPSHFDPAARRAAPPPSTRASSREESEGGRKDRDKVLPRRKPQEPDHPPPGHTDVDVAAWSEYRAFPKSQGYRYWPGRNRGHQPTESKGRTKREKNLNYRLWNEYDREQGRR